MRNTMRLSAVLVLVSLCACRAPETQVVELPEGVKPWTHTRFQSNPDDFQFLVVSDRTGGMRPGVFAAAVDKANLMHPEFVMCVGDLTPGYTEDTAKIDAEWQEFGAIADRFEAPFFRAAGNHDILKKNQKKEWVARFGKPFYSFTYQGALFVVLCSDWPKDNNIGDEQVAWLKETLAANADARWTFVFLHKPLWTYRKVPEGWQRVEEMLAPRRHTVFAGHYHTYTHYDRHGRDYFILSTTGGGNSLNGADFGQLDQFVWVSMTDNGPRFANLEVDAIHDVDMVTTATRPLADALSRSKFVSVGAVLGDSSRFTKGQARIALKNPCKAPLRVQGRFYAHPALLIDPPTFDLTIEPGANQALDVNLAGTGVLDIDEMVPVDLTLTGSYDLPGRPQPISIERTWKVFFDYERTIAKAAKAPTIDADLSDWKAPFIRVDQSPYIQGRYSDYRGAEDGAFEFATAWDADFLYIAMRSTDDAIRLDPEKGPWNQDGFLVELDADANRASERGSWRWRFKRFLVLECAPGESPDKPILQEATRFPKGVRVACRKTDSGLEAEMAVPVAYLNERQGVDWKGVRMNFAMIDVDAVPGEAMDRTALFWKPRWSSRMNYAGSGSFRRD